MRGRGAPGTSPAPWGRGFESRHLSAVGSSPAASWPRVRVPAVPGRRGGGAAVAGREKPEGSGSFRWGDSKRRKNNRQNTEWCYVWVGWVFFFFSPLSFLFCKNQSLFCWSSLKEELGCEELGCELHVLFWKCSCVVWRGLGASHGFSLFTHWP